MLETTSAQSPAVVKGCSTESGCTPLMVKTKNPKPFSDCDTFLFLHFVFLSSVTEEFDPEGENLNLTCILTCAEKCEADFNLTWSERNQNGLQSSLTAAGNTLTKRLLLPFRPPSSQEILCSVQREGALMTSKKWPSVHRT